MSKHDSLPLVIGEQKNPGGNNNNNNIFLPFGHEGSEVLKNTIYDIQISKSRPSRVTIDMNHWLSTAVKSDFQSKSALQSIKHCINVD